MCALISTWGYSFSRHQTNLHFSWKACRNLSELIYYVFSLSAGYFFFLQVHFVSCISPWDGWIASPTPWTWVWVNSTSWWRTGRPGVLQSTGSQKVGHGWTELNWADQPLVSLVFSSHLRSLHFCSSVFQVSGSELISLFPTPASLPLLAWALWLEDLQHSSHGQYLNHHPRSPCSWARSHHTPPPSGIHSLLSSLPSSAHGGIPPR